MSIHFVSEEYQLDTIKLRSMLNVFRTIIVYQNHNRQIREKTKMLWDGV